MNELTKLFEGVDIEEMRRKAEVGGIEGAMAFANAGVVYSKVQTAVLKARLWLSVSDDPRHDKAREILECAEQVKALAASDLPIYGTIEKITKLCEAGDAVTTGRLVKRGREMTGRRKGKKTLGTSAIDKALADLGRAAPAKAVLRHIEASGACCVEGDHIIWEGGKTTKSSGFSSRVSERRKLLD